MCRLKSVLRTQVNKVQEETISENEARDRLASHLVHADDVPDGCAAARAVVALELELAGTHVANAEVPARVQHRVRCEQALQGEWNVYVRACVC
jgi:hypothetical protein